MITNGDIVKLVSDMETHKINYAILIYNKNRIIKPEQKMLLSLLKDNIQLLPITVKYEEEGADYISFSDYANIYTNVMNAFEKKVDPI